MSSSSDSANDNARLQFEAALAACENEPIHIPGAIQPHGMLMALSEPDLNVVAVSANVNPSPQLLLGRTLAEVIPVRSAAAISGALDGDLEEQNPIRVVGPNGATADAVLHRKNGMLLAEFEPPDDGPSSSLGWYQQLRRILRRLQAARSESELCQELTVQIQALTGFDRVMAYRFDEEWNGEVVSEVAIDDIGSYLGLRFPAGDIPANARALYATNFLRLIPSSIYEAVPLLGFSDVPIDLSDAMLRAVSPVHLQYLSNMGVAASMSLSLVVEGRLWGLISCHHYAGEKVLPYRIRAAAELVARTASILIEGVTRTAIAREQAQAIERRSAVTVALAGAYSDAGGVLAANAQTLLALTHADGAVIALDGPPRFIGHTVDLKTAKAIADHLLPGSAGAVGTDFLRDVDPSIATTTAAGALVTPVGDGGELFILWTRDELRRTVMWGGNPENKELQVTASGPRLGPRRSFEAWSENVEGHSAPWSSSDLEQASALGRDIANLIVRRVVERDEVATALSRSLLLEALPDIPGVTMAARYLPAGQSAFGGDWYDVLYKPNGHLVVALGDVAGHGIAAAAITAQLRQGLRAYLLGEADPGVAVGRLNELISWVLPNDLATIIVLDIDIATGRTRVTNAGHLPPLIISEADARYPDIVRAPALGVSKAWAYSSTELVLHDHDTLLVFSDGLIETRTSSLDSGLDRLRALASGDHQEPQALVDVAIDLLWNDSIDDDVTVLAIQLNRDGLPRVAAAPSNS